MRGRAMRGGPKRFLTGVGAVMMLVVVAAAALCGCGAEPPPSTLAGTADDDILTFRNNADNRPIIRIGTQYYTPDSSLYDALQAQFPDYLLVMDYGAAAGIGAEHLLLDALQSGYCYYDMVITGNLTGLWSGQDSPFVDLSSEEFLDDYLLSALNDVSVDGHIFLLPGASTLAGIAFNADMFAEHGWEIPQTHDEFFALCATIRAAGVSPFSTNCKYTTQLTRLLTMMCYAELFETEAGAQWLAGLWTGESDFKGYMEPVYELARRFAEEGLITAADFTASLTQQRQAFWAGEYAMIDYNSAIYTYAESENAPFALGIMAYPALKAENAGFAVTPEYYLSLPRAVEKDPARLALMKEMLAFISTQEGQEAMLKDSLRISSVKGIDLSGNPAAQYAREAYARGNLYPLVYMGGSQSPVHYYERFQATIKSVIEGGSVEEAIARMDQGIDQALAAAGAGAAEEYEVLALAEENFTMLETSYYLADKLRAASGAQIGLMLNNSFFCSNLATLQAGEITAAKLDLFVQKGVGAEDYLTTYRLSGAQLQALLERPIVNGDAVDALFAASGLKIEYAPWNERGRRVLRLTLEDGTELEDDQLYTVAAWAGVIDERYITENLHTYEELGSLADIMAAALKRDGTIRPHIAHRVTLIWPEAA